MSKKATYYIIYEKQYLWLGLAHLFSILRLSKVKKKTTNLSKGIQGAHGYFSLFFFFPI